MSLPKLLNLLCFLQHSVEGSQIFLSENKQSNSSKRGATASAYLETNLRFFQTDMLLQKFQCKIYLVVHLNPYLEVKKKTRCALNAVNMKHQKN
jgi:hypothetical protein